VNKINMYSPNQVFGGSFLGGPIAATYFLGKNFQVLQNGSSARTTLILGSLGTILIFLVVPFLPEKFPNTAIPFAYTFAAYAVASKQQMSKDAIAQSDQHAFESTWKVAGIAVSFMLLFVALMMPRFFFLDYIGIIRP